MHTRLHNQDDSSASAQKSLLQSRPFADESEQVTKSTFQQSPTSLQTKLEDSSRSGHNFGNIPIFSPHPQPLVQAKLTVGEPDNQYEQEADRVAEQVMTMPAPTAQPIQRQTTEEEELQTKPLADSIAPLVQRQMTLEEEEIQTKPTASIQREVLPEEEEELQAKSLDNAIQREALPEEEELQMKPSLQQATDNSLPLESRINNSSGSPLSDDVRAFMEPRFGTDFSNVRVHTGSEAVKLCQAVQAQACAHQNNIYFNEGKYNPNSIDGKHLLAHELTHTIQQQGSSAQQQQRKPELPNLDYSTKVGASSAADATQSRQTVSVSSISGTAPIARKKEAPTPFAGSAGTADIRAVEAGKEAGGFSPINISTEYTTQQAERKEKQMDSFRNADIPFVYDNQEHYAYKKLIELRQEYLNDVSRISLAQGAFNDCVVPGTLANKSIAQFKQVQFELGYFDDVDPAEELTDKERKTLAKNLDEEKMKELNSAVSSNEQQVRGTRKVILGTSHEIQAAMQKRAGILALEAKGKAEKEKTEIEEKIKAVKDGAETVGKVISAVSFVGIGAPAAITDISAGGQAAIKSGLDLGEKGTSLVGSTAEFIMTEMYKEELQKAKQEIQKAKVAEEHAKKMDAGLSLTGSMLNMEGELQRLSGFMEELSSALKARKAYFAKLGFDTDKATGKKPGSKMSQYLLYVSQANETKSHVETAKESAASGLGVMKTQIYDMDKHRNYAYVADSAGVWDDRARIVDGDGPDLKQLKAARDRLDSFIKSADKQLEVINQVISSLPTPM
jgi:hypothetical protein